MATAPSPSAALVRTARNEIERVQRTLSVLEQRRSALLAQLAALDAEAESYIRRRQLLEELTDIKRSTPHANSGRPAPAPARRAIKGRELRREAGRLLWSWKGATQIHYREWFERVLADGYAVGGKDPLASFLTNIRDSPAVLRGSAQGFYRLDPASIQRATQAIAEVEAELIDVERSIDRTYAGERSARSADELRGHRDNLKQRLRRLEADLQELRYVFDEEGVDGAAPVAEDSALRAA